MGILSDVLDAFTGRHTIQLAPGLRFVRHDGKECIVTAVTNYQITYQLARPDWLGRVTKRTVSVRRFNRDVNYYL